jgi:transcriptional regulator with XRE-family HTH domain
MKLNTCCRFCEAIKTLRTQRNITQRALAKMLDVSPGYVGQWEAGLSKPSADVIRKICSVFEVEDVDHLLKLAFAETAPSYVRQSILTVSATNQALPPPSRGSLSYDEANAVALMRRLSADQVKLVIRKLEEWVRAFEASNWDI